MKLAAYAWRLLVIAAVGVAVLWLVGRLRVVFLPLVVVVFLTRILIPPAMWLRERGWHPLLATWTVLLGFLAAFVLLGVLVVPSVVDEFQSLGPTLEDAGDDIERWLVQDSPFDLTRKDVAEGREWIGDRVDNATRSSNDTIVQGAVLVLELLAGMLLGLVLTVFALKDGPRFQRWVISLTPEHRRDEVTQVAASAWDAIGGYLRGAATLGIVEAIIIGLTVQLVGGDLVAPVMLLTFLAAFVPLVGAVVAGAVAVLVTLATGSLTGALIVLVVAIVVQQLDNDILAPFIYGHSLQLHPAVILIAIASGSALFGVAGTFLAVPVTAVVVNGMTTLRRMHAADDSIGEPTGGAT